jgi:hypothetical protein
MRYVAMAVWLALGGCADPDKPKAKAPTLEGDPRMARSLIGQADDATQAGDFAAARKLLAQAERYADVPTRAEIDSQHDATDNAEAEWLSEEVKATAKQGKCKAAIEATHEVVAQGQGVAKYLPAHVSNSIGKCLTKLSEEADSLVTARGLIDDAMTKRVLVPKRFKVLRKQIQEQVEQTVDAEVAPALEQRDFAAATNALDEFVKAGLLREDERERALEKVREAITLAIDEVVLGASKAGAGADALGRVDALLAAGWPDESKRPEALRPKRLELSLSVACRALKCQFDPVKLRFSYGKLVARPVGDPKASGDALVIPSGTAVWEIATGGGMSLVGTQEPGDLSTQAARAAAAFGWVGSKDLRDRDTSELLPPGESLVGVRVWGPLRDQEKNFELGTVLSVVGMRCKVRRLADRVEVDIARAKLRFGVTKHGTKVLGLCSKPDALAPSLIESVKDVQSEQLDPQVTLSCLDEQGKPLGVLKDGVLGSLRMPPEWLAPQPRRGQRISRARPA